MGGCCSSIARIPSLNAAVQNIHASHSAGTGNISTAVLFSTDIAESCCLPLRLSASLRDFLVLHRGGKMSLPICEIVLDSQFNIIIYIHKTVIICKLLLSWTPKNPSLFPSAGLCLCIHINLASAQPHLFVK